MPSLITVGGLPLMRNGKLSTSLDCCCEPGFDVRCCCRFLDFPQGEGYYWEAEIDANGCGFLNDGKTFNLCDAGRDAGSCRTWASALQEIAAAGQASPCKEPAYAGFVLNCSGEEEISNNPVGEYNAENFRLYMTPGSSGCHGDNFYVNKAPTNSPTCADDPLVLVFEGFTFTSNAACPGCCDCCTTGFNVTLTLQGPGACTT